MLDVIAGRAGTGKTERILTEIARALAEDPTGPPILLLVPDQAAFSMEKAMTSRAPGKALARAHVLSFRRLAWRAREDLGGTTVKPIREAGKHAVLALAYEDSLEQLSTFRRRAASPHYMDRLLALIDEFQMHDLSAEGLARVSLRSDVPSDLRAKAADAAILLKRYRELLDGKFVDPYDLLPFLKAHLREWSFVVGARVYIDGFLGFTPQEFGVIEAMLEVGLSVTLALTTAPDALAESPVNPFGPFDQPRSVYRTLAGITERAIGREPTIVAVSGEPSRFQAAPLLSHLESHLFADVPETYRLKLERGPKWEQGAENVEITVAGAANPAAEVAGVLRDMIGLHRRAGLRWGEFAIVVADMRRYSRHVERLCEEFGIPHFMDGRRTLRHHPVAVLLLGLLEIAALPDEQDAYRRLLKTGLLPISSDAADRLENYISERGLGARELLDLSNRRPRSSVDSSVKPSVQRPRQTVAKAIGPVVSSLRVPGLTVRERCSILWDGLTRLKVAREIGRLTERATLRGNFEEANLHESAFAETVQMLDDLVTALGDRSLSLERLAGIVARVYEGVTTGVVPLKLDQVLVTEVERMRGLEARAVYVLGCNEGLFPRRVQESELLTFRDRETLASAGVALFPSGDALYALERYRVYMALTRASGTLTLSYAEGDDRGKSSPPSLIMAEITSLFPPECIRRQTFRDRRAGIDQVDKNLCVTPQRAAEGLAEALRDEARGIPITPLWEAVYDLFAERKWPLADALQPLAAVFQRVQSESLPQDLASRLYGCEFRGSVTRFERFGKCAFAHFADYGLRLQTRNPLAIDGRLRGEFLHAALNEYFALIHGDENGARTFDSGRDEAVLTVLSQARDRVLARMQGDLLTKTARGRQEVERMFGVLSRVVHVLSQYSRRSRFRFWKSELSFGFSAEGGLPPYELGEVDGVKVLLRGRIDRLDVFEDGGNRYFSVIDFKSGRDRLELDAVWYGLSFQLPLYARYAEVRGQEVFGGESRVAGFFYLPLRDPIKSVLAPEPLEKADVTRRRETKFQGLLVGDQGIAEALDREAASGGTDLFGYTLKKNGDFHGSATAVYPDIWVLLAERVEESVRGYARRAMAGETSIAPYRKGMETACDLCHLRPVCQFEPESGLGEYRLLKKRGNTQMLTQIKAQSEAGNDG